MLWEQGVVPEQSRSFIMMMGSALAFLTFETLFVIVQAPARFRRLSSRRRIEIKEARHRWAKRGFDTPLSGLLNRRLAYPPNAYHSLNKKR
jgi:hypothetical protein